ncbi:MAG: hypothetical protein AAF215_35690 [Cyanobacteria bacterium P01_A01_bin.123]
MNATSQAITVDLTSKIAHLAVLFRAEFPEARVDLSPWLTDTKTQRQLDPHSIDLSFHFPKRNDGLACSCVLIQVHFSGGLLLPDCQLRTIEASGFDRMKQQWRFSTEGGEFMGIFVPAKDYETRFRYLITRIMLLFKHANRVTSGFDFHQSMDR